MSWPAELILSSLFFLIKKILSKGLWCFFDLFDPWKEIMRMVNTYLIRFTFIQFKF